MAGWLTQQCFLLGCIQRLVGFISHTRVMLTALYSESKLDY